MDTCHKSYNVHDPSILSWSGELLMPELYEKSKKAIAKAKGLPLRNFLRNILRDVQAILPEIVQVKMPPYVDKVFGPLTAPYAMVTPVLAT